MDDDSAVGSRGIVREAVVGVDRLAYVLEDVSAGDVDVNGGAVQGYLTGHVQNRVVVVRDDARGTSIVVCEAGGNAGNIEDGLAGSRRILVAGQGSDGKHRGLG